jgi:branched-chain amino acid transport system permease protein
MPLQVQIFLETLLNGLTLGGLYALVTLGLALTFSVIGLVNFAHGDLFMVSGYTLFLLLNYRAINIPYPVIILILILMGAVYAIIMERIAIHPIIEKTWRTHAVATLGVSIILQNAALIYFSGDPR